MLFNLHGLQVVTLSIVTDFLILDTLSWGYGSWFWLDLMVNDTSHPSPQYAFQMFGILFLLAMLVNCDEL